MESSILYEPRHSRFLGGWCVCGVKVQNMCSCMCVRSVCEIDQVTQSNALAVRCTHYTQRRKGDVVQRLHIHNTYTGRCLQNASLPQLKTKNRRQQNANEPVFRLCSLFTGRPEFIPTHKLLPCTVCIPYMWVYERFSCRYTHSTHSRHFVYD